MVARAVAALMAVATDVDRQRAEATVQPLVARQDDPPRRYHTTRHLVEVLAEVDRLTALTGVIAPPSLVLAVLFHDVVYDPTRDDNERRSAGLARAVLGGWVEAGVVDEVVRLVELTSDHAAAPDDRPGALLVDADLWILSAPAPRYDRYLADVRAEYAHVSDHDWRRGRGRVVTALDDRLATVGYLVGPVADRDRRTGAARANLARERSGRAPVCVDEADRPPRVG